MDCTVTLTANAGCIVRMGTLCFLLDALHDTLTREFSSLSAARTEEVFSLLESCQPQYLLLTHRHPDHFSPALSDRFLKSFPSAKLILPSSAGHISDGGTDIEWFPLRHQKDLGDNFGFTVTREGKMLFTAGDADPSDIQVRELVSRLEPDLALLNFPWLTLRGGREALELLAPDNLALIHLPFRGEDAVGYVSSAEAAAAKYYKNARIMCEYMQEESFCL